MNEDNINGLDLAEDVFQSQEGLAQTWARAVEGNSQTTSQTVQIG